MTVCDECGAPIDESSGFCISCGLETADFGDRRFNKSVLHGASEVGQHESRERDIRKAHQYGYSRGFTCILCLELFQPRPESVLEHEAKMTGMESAGTDLAHFLLKQDLSLHVKLVHGGWKEYWRRVNSKKYMAQVRALASDRLNKEPSVNTYRAGSDFE